jgi:hypothetical protein
VKVTEYEAPAFMFPELNDEAPDGTVVEVTVCGRVSLLFHVTTPPLEMVTFAGLKFND